MMMVSCGSEIRTSWKVIIKSWKVEAQDKSGQSFAQFYARPEIPPVSVFFLALAMFEKKCFFQWCCWWWWYWKRLCWPWTVVTLRYDRQHFVICTSSDTGALNVRVCELITGLVFVPWGPNSTDLNRHSAVDTDHYFDNFDHFGHVDSVAKRDI